MLTYIIISKLSQIIVHILDEKGPLCVTELLCRGGGATYVVHLRLTGNLVVDIVLIELFCQVLRLRRYDHTNEQGCRLFVRFSLGEGSEFRLATGDYSGHGGCQIGTVE